MKVFLIIAGIIVISEILDFILKIADVIFGRKKLRLENDMLKSQLKEAQKRNMDNLGVFAEMMMSSESGKEIENLKSRNAELLMENMRLKSLIGAYRNVYGNDFRNSTREVPQDVLQAVKYAMKHAHPDNGGNADDFIRFQKCYEELTRK